MAIHSTNTPGKVLIGLVIFLALVWLPQHALGCGNFAASCSNTRLSGSTLTSNCKTTAGNYVTSSINLNEHIMNNDGHLQCASGGGAYSASCSNSYLSDSHTLASSCKTKVGGVITTSVDLNGCIANINGKLAWCF